jgi:hypothetical protein
MRDDIYWILRMSEKERFPNIKRKLFPKENRAVKSWAWEIPLYCVGPAQCFHGLWWFALSWPFLICCAQNKFELLDAKSVYPSHTVIHTLTSPQGPARRIQRSNFSSLRFTTVAKGGLQGASSLLAVSYWIVIQQVSFLSCYCSWSTASL